MSDAQYQLPVNVDNKEIDILEGAPPKYNITELVKNNFVHFDFYRQGHFHYKLITNEREFTFPVPLEDISGATLNATDKALVFMRWIRRAIEDKTFIKL